MSAIFYNAVLVSGFHKTKCRRLHLRQSGPGCREGKGWDSRGGAGAGRQCARGDEQLAMGSSEKHREKKGTYLGTAELRGAYGLPSFMFSFSTTVCC